MRQSKRIAINTLSGWLGQLVNAAVLIFFWKYLINALGVERFGVLRYVLAIQGSLTFLDLGISATLNRFTSRLVASGDVDRLNAAFSFGMLVYFAMGLVGAAVMAGMGMMLPSLVIGAKEATYASGMLLMFCMGGALAFRFWGYAARSLLFGLQRYDLVNFGQAGIMLARAGIVVLVLEVWEDAGLVSVGLCYLGTGVLETGLLWAFGKWQFPALRLRVRRFERDLVKDVLGFSAFVLIYSLMSILIENLPIFFAGRFFGAEAVAYIALPLLLLAQLSKLSGAFAKTLVPVAGKFGALGRMEVVRDMVVRGTKFCAILCIPVGVLGIVFGEPLMEWFKEGYGWTWVLLAILMAPYLLWIPQSPAFSVLLGTGSIRGIALGRAVVVVAIVALSWLFGVYFEMGLYGVALGTAAPTALFAATFRPVYTCRQFGLGTLGYLWRSYARVVLLTIPVAGLGGALVWLAYPESLVMILLEGGVCMAVFGAVAWVWVLGPDERRQVRGLFEHHRGDA